MVEAIGNETDLLHIPFGLLIFFIVALLLRQQKYGLFLALLILIALQALNEVLDGIQWRIWTGRVSWMEAVEDSALTIAFPLVITAGVALAKGRRRPVDERNTMSGAMSERSSDDDVGKASKR